MLTMPKKKPHPEPEPQSATTPFRPPDARLIVQLDEYARRIRRSRNMAMVILLEEALGREGLWPPPDAD